MHTEGVEITTAMTFTTTLVENTAATTFASQLEADLATGVRGGNKFRLVARCYVACQRNPHTTAPLSGMDYDQFRAVFAKKTFRQLHEIFDLFLPLQYRADKGAAPAAAPAPAKQLSKKAEKLARSFERTPDLNDEQRQWVRDHGGVEALDARKMRLPNGRVFAFLDNSWHGTAQAIQGVIDGTKELI